MTYHSSCDHPGYQHFGFSTTDIVRFLRAKGLDEVVSHLPKTSKTDALPVAGAGMGTTKRDSEELRLLTLSLKQSEAERNAARDEVLACVAEVSDLRKKVAELQAAQAEIEHLKSLAPPRPDARLMDAVIATQRQFWANWHEGMPRPKSQEEILPWIRGKFPSLTSADAAAVDRVACPIDRNPASKGNGN